MKPNLVTLFFPPPHFFLLLSSLAHAQKIFFSIPVSVSFFLHRLTSPSPTSVALSCTTYVHTYAQRVTAAPERSQSDAEDPERRCRRAAERPASERMHRRGGPTPPVTQCCWNPRQHVRLFSAARRVPCAATHLADNTPNMRLGAADACLRRRKRLLHGRSLTHGWPVS